MTDKTTYAPFIFFEYDHKPGSYCLMLSDTHMFDAEAPFAAAGHEPSGYSWEAVARAAVATRAPELAGRVSFDPEAGMFVAYGTDPEALKALGALLHTAFHTPATLTALVTAADPAWFD